MPTLEDYRRIRQIGAYKQEQADLEQVQGNFLERIGNEALKNEVDEDESEEESKKKKKGMPDFEKAAVIRVLKKVK